MTSQNEEADRNYNTTMMLKDAKWMKKLPNHYSTFAVKPLIVRRQEGIVYNKNGGKKRQRAVPLVCNDDKLIEMVFRRYENYI